MRAKLGVMTSEGEAPKGMKRVKDLGSVGDVARLRVKAERERRGWSAAELARKVEENGRALSPLAVRRLEAGARRVDVDDLVALALALEVSPLAFLVPPGDAPDNTFRSTADAPEYPLRQWWRWLIGQQSMDPWGKNDLAFRADSLPPWFSDEIPELGHWEGLQGRIEKANHLINQGSNVNDGRGDE